MTTSPSKQIYKKHYIPLESNPEVFTTLIHRLGVSPDLEWVDVYSIDDPELLAFVARPVHALVLVFPTTAAYEAKTKIDEDKRTQHIGSGLNEKVIWYKQTINNACGLYGILHAVSNGPARDHINENSTLKKLLTSAIPLEPKARAQLLEGSVELEEAHREAAMQGDSVVPENAEDEVDYHYICFVKSRKDGHLYELDGDKKGPIDMGPMDGEDLLEGPGQGAIRACVNAEQGANAGFALLALVPS